MPPTLGDRLVHILEAIDYIQTLLEGKTITTISRNRTLRLAIERSFEIICEAAKHVPDQVKERESAIDWSEMNALGNLLRHAYHRVDISRLADIAAVDLPPLKAFVERVIEDEKNK